MTTPSLLHRFLLPALLTGGLFLAACEEPPPAQPEFLSVLPSYAALSLQMDATDAELPSEVAQAPTSPGAQTKSCAPRLFVRAHASVRHLNKSLEGWTGRLAELTERPPSVRTSLMHQWDLETSNLMERLTVTRDPSGKRWTYALDVAPASSRRRPAFRAVMRGTRDTENESAQPREQVIFDNDALRSADPSLAQTGRISYRRESASSSRATAILAVSFQGLSSTPTEGGASSGNYTLSATSERQTTLQLTDDGTADCGAKGSSQPSQFALTAVWYAAKDGTWHGRADARARGGGLPRGVLWEASTCHQGAVVSAENETFWETELRRITPQGTLLHREVSEEFPESACDTVLAPGRPPPFLAPKS